MKNSSNVRLPPRLDYGSEVMSGVDSLISHEQSEAEYSNLASDTTGERLFGYVLPPFQRPPVWTREQQVRFVESLWLRLPVGHYVVNRVDEVVNGKLHRMDGWLIDGQQRLRALRAFFNDEFPLFGLRWSAFNPVESRAFRLVGFPHYVVMKSSEDELRDLYNRLAFGGTPHEESQRA